LRAFWTDRLAPQWGQLNCLTSNAIVVSLPWL
jgi:hypothetical protein